MYVAGVWTSTSDYGRWYLGVPATVLDDVAWWPDAETYHGLLPYVYNNDAELGKTHEDGAGSEDIHENGTHPVRY